MRKPGCDPDNLSMSDVQCDFCMAEWSDLRPMVEGHRGSCICGQCLAHAYRCLVLDTAAADAGADAAAKSDVVTGEKCALCLENRQEPMWQSPLNPESAACLRCVRQSAAVLQKDPDSQWRRPV